MSIEIKVGRGRGKVSNTLPIGKMWVELEPKLKMYQNVPLNEIANALIKKAKMKDGIITFHELTFTIEHNLDEKQEESKHG